MRETQEKTKSSDRRPRIYAILDACFLLLYLLMVTSIIPSRALGGLLLQWLLVLAMAIACVGMLLRRPAGWRLALAGCALLVLLELALLVLILLSASYLAGVYGSFGQAASALALVVALLSIQLVALLPAFQMKYLLSRAGRRAYRRS